LGSNQNIGKGVIITDDIIGVYQLFMGPARAAPKVYAYEWQYHLRAITVTNKQAYILLN